MRWYFHRFATSRDTTRINLKSIWIKQGGFGSSFHGFSGKVTILATNPADATIGTLAGGHRHWKLLRENTRHSRILFNLCMKAIFWPIFRWKRLIPFDPAAHDVVRRDLPT